MSEPAPQPRPRRLARHFRWQALFQHTADAVFLLNRRQRLLFVNHAWEKLTGLPAAEAAGLLFRRPRPSSPGDAWEDVLQHALTPPPDALQGIPARTRRLLPGQEGIQTRSASEGSARWWEVDFLPLRPEGKAEGFFLLGRIRVLPAEAPAGAAAAPLPERLVNLRQQAVARCGLALWSDSEVPAVRRLVAQARLAGQVAAPVLLVGEAGTGKQTLARAVHALGPARERAFAALDCLRLPPAFVAGVLFGSTGAGSAPPFGAIHLKNPECLPSDLQARLCEWLAQAEGRADRPRLFAGLRQSPAGAVRSGRLLEELACVLGILVLEVPPLRERRADLPGMVERLLARANTEGAVRVAGLAADAWEVVRGYSWPGNVRQLYRALAAAQGRCHGDRISAADLPAAVRRAVRLEQAPGGPPAKSLSLNDLLKQAERRLIELALRRAGGNVTRAAQALGVWRQRLKRRMVKLGLAPAQDDDGDEGDDEAE
jgi:PAS domain S-box-containing protein